MQVVLQAVNSLMPYKQKSPDTTKVVTGLLVRVTGFEPAASCSQSMRATNCATPGLTLHILQDIMKMSSQICRIKNDLPVTIYSVLFIFFERSREEKTL